jgi:hypothetical protein
MKIKNGKYYIVYNAKAPSKHHKHIIKMGEKGSVAFGLNGDKFVKTTFFRPYHFSEDFDWQISTEVQDTSYNAIWLKECKLANKFVPYEAAITNSEKRAKQDFFIEPVGFKKETSNTIFAKTPVSYKHHNRFENVVLQKRHPKTNKITYYRVLEVDKGKDLAKLEYINGNGRYYGYKTDSWTNLHNYTISELTWSEIPRKSWIREKLENLVKVLV